jgi:hypothetical protein
MAASRRFDCDDHFDILPEATLSGPPFAVKRLESRVMIWLILLQAAAPPPAPDIELNLHLRAKSVRIDQRGEARLEVRGEGPGNRVDVHVEPKAQGRTELRNVTVDIHAQASVVEGAQIDAKAETGTPQ